MFVRAVLFALAILAASCLPAVAQTAPTPAPFASPMPSLDHPRRVVLSLSERDPARVNEVLSNIGNVQKFYGADNVQIALIAYGPGVHALLNDESTVRARILSLLAIGIDIFACEATLQSLHRPASDLIAGVRTTPNGIPAIVELQAAGWYYVRP